MGTSENLAEIMAHLTLVSVSVPVAATDANWPDCIFIADKAYELVSFVERHKTAGNDVGAVTVRPVKCNDAEAVGAGDNMTSTTADLKGAADTKQSLTVVADGKEKLAVGDAIHLLAAGTKTTLAGVCITMALREL